MSTPPVGENPWDSPDDEIENRPVSAAALTLEQERRGRFILSLVAVLLAPFVIDLPITALFRVSAGHGDPGVPAVVLGVSIFIARFSFLGMWLAWGGSRLIWRIMATYISLFFSCAVFGISNEDRHATEAYSMAMLLITIFAAMMAIPKLFGIRWVLVQELDNPAAVSHQRRQFSLIDMFLWTFTVAFVLGVFRWLGFPDFRGEPSVIWFFIVTGIGLGAPAVASLLSMWAALHRSDDVQMRIIVSSVMVLLLLSPLLLLSGAGNASGEALFALLFTIVGTLFCLMAPLFALRSWGHRLIRVP
jgi:MFS family permease